MAPAENPITLEQILATAEDVIRRHGPAKANVVDVARALGVSHAAVYRHVASKAELRNLVVGRWAGQTMAPLQAIAAATGPAPERLRNFFDTLMAGKHRRAAADPELFAAFRTLSGDAASAVETHVAELTKLTAQIIRAGVDEGSFRPVDPIATAQAILFATARFHHPAHAADWTAPNLRATFDDLWEILMRGLNTTP